MTPPVLTIWSNARLPGGTDAVAAAFAPHRLVATEDGSAGLEEADVAFGQPEVEAVMAAPRLRLVQLSSAGWDRFDRPDVRGALAAAGTALTTSSGVYREPCAQHALALMLAHARRLPTSFAHQHGDHAWPQAATRAACRLLGPEDTVLLVGFGAIAARLAELLAPFGPRVLGVRRRARGDEPVPIVPLADLDRHLPNADYVVSLLPGGPATRHLFDARTLARMKPGAVLVNIGRGTTVEEEALARGLRAGRPAAAYLDVTDPEPLPPEHPLWTTPGCVITPHAAGGHADEAERLRAHAAANVRRLLAGEPLVDRVV